MVDVVRLNYKYLIPTDGKNKELIHKLKPGEIVSAKVIEASKDKVLLNIKGTEVMTETSRQLQKGDVVKLKIENVNNEQIFVKIEDEKPKLTGGYKAGEVKPTKEEVFTKVKEGVVSEVIKEKAFLKEEKIDSIVERYIKTKNEDNFKETINLEKIKSETIVQKEKSPQTENGEDKKNVTTKEEVLIGQPAGTKEHQNEGVNIENEDYIEQRHGGGGNSGRDTKQQEEEKHKNAFEKNGSKQKIFGEIKGNVLYLEKGVDKTLTKALVFIENNGLIFNEELLGNLRSYYNKNRVREIDLSGDVKESIKQALKDMAEGKNEFDRGNNIVNAVHEQKRDGEREFTIALGSVENRATIKIKNGEKGKTEKIEKENFSLNIELNMEHLGKIGVKMGVWNKNASIVFNTENEEAKEVIGRRIEELKNKIEAAGFGLKEARVKSGLSEELNNPSIKGVNVKI